MLPTKRILAVTVKFLLGIVAILWLATAPPVQAQCGSQASSCKNCHEVQGQLPVNNDGTSWHQSHAFGDFCAVCHAGNSQVMDAESAHTGLVAPMEDVKAACQQCHTDDLMERAQVYASVLAVEVGVKGEDTGAPSKVGGEEAVPSEESSTEMSAPMPLVGEQPMVDYVEQYQRSVQAEGKINWGNSILGLMVLILLLFGGLFVYLNEKKRRGGAKSMPESLEVETSIGPQDYPPDVLELLPLLTGLNPVGRRALKMLLQNPDAASELLHSLSRLDPDLIRRVRALGRESRALLLVLAGD
jgi:hypothetical protein